MKDLTSNRSFRFMVCLVCCLFVVSSLASVFAVDTETQLQSKEALMAYYIWVFLDSIGIEVTYLDVLGYVDEMQDTIIDWVIQYIADEIEADVFPSNYSISQWIAPWQAQYDYWGNLQFNSTMLEDLEDFAEWLKVKLSLIDDSTVVVNPVYSVNGYSLYLLDSYYTAIYEDGSTYDQYIAIGMQEYYGSQNRPVGYSVIGRPAEVGGQIVTIWQYIIFFQYGTTGTWTYEIVGLDNYGVDNQIAVGGNDAYNTNTLNTQYYLISAPLRNNMAIFPNGHNILTDSNSAYQAFVNNMHIVSEGNIKIVTAEIVMPIDNPDYTIGDGVTIIDGNPEYGDITFSGIVTNLPAIVSTGNIPVPGDELNPGLVNAWHPISTLIEMTADSMGLLIGIVYEFPEEVIIPIFAVLGGIIIFGIIHAMKEH